MNKYGGMTFVVAALVALTGCASSEPVAEIAPSTIAATTSPEVKTVTETPAATPSAGAPREMTKAELDEYLGMAQQMMGGYGFDKSEISKTQILAESKKICAEGADYKGLPMLNKVEGATGMLAFWADANFC